MNPQHQSKSAFLWCLLNAASFFYLSEMLLLQKLKLALASDGTRNYNKVILCKLLWMIKGKYQQKSRRFIPARSSACGPLRRISRTPPALSGGKRSRQNCLLGEKIININIKLQIYDFIFPWLTVLGDLFLPSGFSLRLHASVAPETQMEKT